MKLAQCAAFVAIADTGTFTSAATALGVTQSAVSHAIAGLEAELGVALMKRDRSGVKLTDVGRRVLGHARAVILHTEQMRQETDLLRTDAGGTIRIGTSQSFAVRLLPRLMTEFRSTFPRLEIALREGTDAQITEWLRGYALDVGIVTLPKRDLTTIPLLQDEWYTVLPDSHPLAGSRALRIHDLRAESLIMPEGGVEPMLRTIFRTAGLEPVVAHRVRDVNALLAMVAEGLALTVLPALALPALPPGLRALPFEPTVTRHLAIGVRGAAGNSPAVKAFIATAQALARRNDWSHRPAQHRRTPAPTPAPTAGLRRTAGPPAVR
ncbi:LysR substrate-binding domain-containing protein [Kitasatospora sp. NBC_00374]|uniref:LysR family transcriptional regulator n=1 Tax=Kitasatospora sp. NBC_00374 TaxID=2975964 RepID=UPI0030E3CE79